MSITKSKSSVSEMNIYNLKLEQYETPVRVNKNLRHRTDPEHRFNSTDNGSFQYKMAKTLSKGRYIWPTAS